jgi:hypothetical protein
MAIVPIWHGIPRHGAIRSGADGYIFFYESILKTTHSLAIVNTRIIYIGYIQDIR